MDSLAGPAPLPSSCKAKSSSSHPRNLTCRESSHSFDSGGGTTFLLLVPIKSGIYNKLISEEVMASQDRLCMLKHSVVSDPL